LFIFKQPMSKLVISAAIFKLEIINCITVVVNVIYVFRNSSKERVECNKNKRIKTIFQY